MPSVATIRAERVSAKRECRAILTNAAAAAGVVFALVFGCPQDAHAQPPGLNISQTCRTAAGAMATLASENKQNHFDQCVESEQKARAVIVKDWTTFSSADKARCLQTKVYLPNYVEWQSCLETAREVRKLRASQPASDAARQVALPAPAAILNIGAPVRRPTAVATPTPRARIL